MKNLEKSLLIRLPLAIILLTHSVFGVFNNGINDFGNLFLNEIGFYPFGIPMAWTIKSIHFAGAILLILNRYIKLVSILNIVIFFAGIVLIHYREGWFVVGGGRNGFEYNFLLICNFLYLILITNSKNK